MSPSSLVVEKWGWIIIYHNCHVIHRILLRFPNLRKWSSSHLLSRLLLAPEPRVDIEWEVAGWIERRNSSRKTSIFPGAFGMAFTVFQGLQQNDAKKPFQSVLWHSTRKFQINMWIAASIPGLHIHLMDTSGVADINVRRENSMVRTKLKETSTRVNSRTGRVLAIWALIGFSAKWFLQKGWSEGLKPTSRILVEGACLMRCVYELVWPFVRRWFGYGLDGFRMFQVSFPTSYSWISHMSMYGFGMASPQQEQAWKSPFIRKASKSYGII